MQKEFTTPATPAGLIVLSLRLVAGWTYFSAFWRRLVLENKLDPDAPGYIGEKFNHFLPQALGIKPIIQYLVSHPDLLHRSMWGFTIAEAIVGLCFMFGLMTRWMSVLVVSLAAGILLGAGWLGTTCLDEWQIGVLGIAAGFTVFVAGGGPVSLDHIFGRGRRFFYRQSIPLQNKKLVITGAIVITFLTLFTNQYFHGGVWGTLHNRSIRPVLEITNARIQKGELVFEIQRTEGADVYGSFLIGVQIENDKGEIVFSKTGAGLSAASIVNSYVAKVKGSKYSLVIPLGAKAVLRFKDVWMPRGNYVLRLIDVSGLEWTATIDK